MRLLSVLGLKLTKKTMWQKKKKPVIVNEKKIARIFAFFFAVLMGDDAVHSSLCCKHM